MQEMLEYYEALYAESFEPKVRAAEKIPIIQ